jgi:hypothetical protein
MIGPASLPSVASDLLLTLNGDSHHLPARLPDFMTVLKKPVSGMVNRQAPPPIRPIRYGTDPKAGLCLLRMYAYLFRRDDDGDSDQRRLGRLGGFVLATGP